jgi:hypothetical protein
MRWNFHYFQERISKDILSTNIDLYVLDFDVIISFS